MAGCEYELAVAVAPSLIAAGEGWQAAGDAGMPQGHFQGLRTGRGGAKMPFVCPCDPLIERGLMSSGRSQSQRLCNLMRIYETDY
jgi:hypothetical protein